EIGQLRGTYEAVHKRYLQQQLELEATQSELHRIRSLISATEAQRALRESEQRDLLALMHPVRRCPDDILREIFECVVRGFPNRKAALKESFHLSSVCRKWRTVAISTPFLWKRLNFDLRRPSDVLKHQQETLVSRIKSQAAEIQVGDIDYPSGGPLSACGLKMFPLIEHLMLVLSRPEGILPLLRPGSLFSAGRVRKVYIQSIPTPGIITALLPHPLPVGSNLLMQFPGLTSAMLNGLANITFQLTEVISTLTDLTIDNARQVLIGSILTYCPKLDSLKIKNATIAGISSPTPVVTSSLRYLELVAVEGETWMARASLPKLDTLVLFTDTTPASLAFISSHRSIKKLFCKNSPTDIVNIAPQLIELHALPPLQSLHTPSPPSQVALPSLRHLFVNMTASNHTITAQEFDTFVRTRCLRVDHPENLAKQPSHVPLRIMFALPVNTQPQGWQQSKLYKESTRSEYTHPFYSGKVMRLTWPVKKT
ncbi:hypothetical protein M408DRAFT_27981, partial [Serendipita vermifera MAFF 305830]